MHESARLGAAHGCKSWGGKLCPGRVACLATGVRSTWVWTLPAMIIPSAHGWTRFPAGPTFHLHENAHPEFTLGHDFTRTVRVSRIRPGNTPHRGTWLMLHVEGDWIFCRTSLCLGFPRIYTKCPIASLMNQSLPRPSHDEARSDFFCCLQVLSHDDSLLAPCSVAATSRKPADSPCPPHDTATYSQTSI
jgi:hypothetical protein